MNENNYKIQGGALTSQDQTYVSRLSDKTLYEFAKSRHKNNRICTVFAPRQMGKSSLMECTTNRLRSQGVYCVCINLHELAEVNSDKELWKSILDDICEQVPSASRNFPEQLDQYWFSHQDLPPAKILTNFLLNEILPNTGEQIISIFLDEIQSLVDWELEDSFVRYMKAIAENARNPLLERLNFVFLGVAKPSDFVTKQGATLNVGQQIDIGYLSGECLPLQQGLAKITHNTKQAINRILWHTNGLPFLTQYVCYQAVANFPDYINNYTEKINIDNYIDLVVDEYVIKNWRSEDKQKHFESIDNSFIRACDSQKELKIEGIKLYEQILKGEKVVLDRSNIYHVDLIVTGIIRKETVKNQEILVVTNPIYERIFGIPWVKEMGERLGQKLSLNTPNTNQINLAKPMTTRNTEMIDQIEEILAQREPIVEKIQAVEMKLKVLIDTLTALEDFHKGMVQQVNLTPVASANQLNPQKLKSMIFDELANLVKIRERLSRKYLTFGTIGFMGHGKSTLLQQISGLTNDEIPARKGDACTAVCSTIYFHKGETYATIKFHTEQSFLEEVIGSFYRELGLGSHPKTLDEFAQPLPKFQGDTTKKAMYEYLQRYQAKLPVYRGYLSKNQPKQISENTKDNISKFVAQQTDSFENLAVKEVEIYCHTDRDELTNVALVDIPGTGDFKPLDEKLMRDALEEKVDLVFFVHRPDPVRYQWQTSDTNLYVKAANALNNLANRSFMILNLFSNNSNLEACQNKQKTISQKHINVVNCEIVNCTNQADVRQVFDQSLQYLATNLPSLDHKYAEPYQDRLVQLHRNLSIELERARESLTTGLPLGDLNETEKFERLFQVFWSKLTTNLEELVSSLNDYTNDDQEAAFKQQIDVVIQECNNNRNVPNDKEDEIENSIKQVTLERYRLGDWSSAYSAYLHNVRTNLTQHFHSMDNDLKKTVEAAKSLVKEVFVNQELLGELVNSDMSGSQFLREMYERIPPRLINLKQAFKTLLEFEMSYRSNFHYRIRPLLSNLNPNTTKLHILPIAGRETEEAKQQKAQEIIDYLNVLYDETVFNCEDALKGLYSEPRQAAFAEVEAFVDQVLRANNVQTEWRIFLSQEKTLVWQDEYNTGTTNYSLEEWNKLVSNAISANQLELFQFI